MKNAGLWFCDPWTHRMNASAVDLKMVYASFELQSRRVFLSFFQSSFCDFLEISTSTTLKHLQRFWWSSNNEELLRSSSVPSSIKRETDRETNPESERQILSARSSQRGIVGISLARETTGKAEQENDWKLLLPLPSLPPLPIGFGAREGADEEVEILKLKRETDFHLESIRPSNPRSLFEMQRESESAIIPSAREYPWEHPRERFF